MYGRQYDSYAPVECEYCCTELPLPCYGDHLNHCTQFFADRWGSPEPPADGPTAQLVVGTEPLLPVLPKTHAEQEALEPSMHTKPEQATSLGTDKSKVVTGRPPMIQSPITALVQSNTKLTMEINNVEQKRKQSNSVSIESKPFYAHLYKLCLRVYLNGDGEGTGTHLSVFFVIMRGEHDPLLRWPFNHKVIFKMETMDGGSISGIVLPDATSIAYQKPQSDTNIASGCPMFIPLERLVNELLHNDTIFIKCIVD